MHSRSKLAAILWPDSAARTALSNAIALLRSRLADTSSTGSSHLLYQQDLLGLDPQTWLDVDVVQHAYQQAQHISTIPPEQERTSLVNTLQHALSLVRGPFLDGFWLREETPFDGWVQQQQQQQWQVRLHLLYDRLSRWQEAGGELEQAQITLVRWLALDPLVEEAYRRLMRVHMALGDASAAFCRTRLAQELQVEPSAETIKLATHIHTTVAHLPGNHLAHSLGAASQSPDSLIAPLVGRTSAFTKLVSCYQQAQLGQPQTVLLAGIGKTRLASVGEDGSVCRWEASDGKLLQQFQGHHGVVMSVAWSPDATRLASGGSGRGGGGEIFIWEVSSGQRLQTWSETGAIVYALVWGPTAAMLLSSESGEAR